VTPVPSKCCLQWLSMGYVICGMRRATSLVYFGPDSSLFVLWQNAQPSYGAGFDRLSPNG